MDLKIKIVNQENTKKKYKFLKDINELGLKNDQFVTAEALATEFRIAKEFALKTLAVENVEPIAKIINRKDISNGTEVLRGGRPRLAFEPQLARVAIERGVERLYGKE